MEDFKKHVVDQNTDNKSNEVTNLFQKISQRIEHSRNEIVKNANTVLLINNYEIGRYIVEEEQNGDNRAEYGKKVLKELSRLLINSYGRGWSERNLRSYCLFYLTFSNLNLADVYAKFKEIIMIDM